MQMLSLQFVSSSGLWSCVVRFSLIFDIRSDYKWVVEWHSSIPMTLDTPVGIYQTVGIV